MKESEHIKDVNYGMLAKFLSDEASDAEIAEVESWAGQSAENQAVLQNGSDIMQKAGLYFHTRKFNPARAWDKVSKITEESIPEVETEKPVPVISFRKRWMRVAASLLLALMLGSAGFYIGIRQQKTTIFTEVVSNKEQVLQGVTLPDGTVVTLNNNSKLNYPKHFSGKYRKVSIEGEAFFEVKHDASKPFVISAGKAQIRVLGTSFNVCARPGDKTVEVTVETGKVQFGCQKLAQQPCQNLILTPGEKGIMFTSDHSMKKSLNENPNVTAWKTRDLVFHKTRLSEVILDLEKVYHTDIQLSDPSLNELILTAHFDNQPIDFIVEVIRLTFNLELSAQNGQYFLTAATNKH
jgi:ferric-dicitrate binding protein FerR (iron transport regulator)